MPKRLERLIKGGWNFFKEILKTRPDLAASMLDNPMNNAEKLLLWAWMHGRHEMEVIKEHEPMLIDWLSALHHRNYDSSFPLYTMLLHSIWLARSDLKHLSPETTQGKMLILLWFYSHGVHEYNFLEMNNILRPIDRELAKIFAS